MTCLEESPERSVRVPILTDGDVEAQPPHGCGAVRDRSELPVPMRGSDPMTASFADLYARAAARKGGVRVLEGLLPVPKTPVALAAIPDDRWLAEMTRRLFQYSFYWSGVEDRRRKRLNSHN